MSLGITSALRLFKNCFDRADVRRQDRNAEPHRAFQIQHQTGAGQTSGRKNSCGSGEKVEIDLIIGAGKMGASLGNKLLSLGNEVVIADTSEEVASRLTENYTDVFIGDCTNEAVLRSLGVNNFDVRFVTVGENFQ